MARRKPTLALGTDEYALVMGRQAVTAEYGDPCKLMYGARTFLALIHETGDGERLSLLGHGVTVMECKPIEHLTTVYDEYKGDKPVAYKPAQPTRPKPMQTTKSVAGAPPAGKQSTKDSEGKPMAKIALDVDGDDDDVYYPGPTKAPADSPEADDEDTETDDDESGLEIEGEALETDDSDDSDDVDDEDDDEDSDGEDVDDDADDFDDDEDDFGEFDDEDDEEYEDDDEEE